MYFERIDDEGLAQASYMIGCAASGEAVVVDPRRDIDIYLERAEEHDFELVGAVETHIHADFLCGGRELAAATGCTLYISGETTERWEYGGLEGLEVISLRDGEAFSVGNIRIEAVHTPGHTPEHLSYLVTDGAASEDPMMFLTGDFAFVGDLGRPDLLEEAAGEEGAARACAEVQFESVSRLLEVSDHILLWPGHGAGSACGKALGSLPASTVGYERRSAWWSKYFGEEPDCERFVEELLADQPESPDYFRQMKIMNRDGAPILGGIPSPMRLSPGRFRQLADEGAIVCDLGDPEAFAHRHIAGSVSLPSLRSLSTHAGWIMPYDGSRMVLVGEEAWVEEATRRLVRIGLDAIAGWLPRSEALSAAHATASFSMLEVDEAHRLWESGEAQILDVRAADEHAEGHIPDATHIHYGRLDEAVEELDAEVSYIVHCASGVRASLACSLLERAGIGDVRNFPGGPTAWEQAGHRLV